MQTALAEKVVSSLCKTEIGPQVPVATQALAITHAVDIVALPLTVTVAFSITFNF
jgi:hypothetical protein